MKMHASSAKPISDNHKVEAIQSWIIAKLAQALQVAPDEIDVRAPFSSYGLESIAVFSLTGDLAQWLGEEMPATLFWDCPTIEALTNYLCEQYPEATARISGREEPAEHRHSSVKSNFQVGTDTIDAAKVLQMRALIPRLPPLDEAQPGAASKNAPMVFMLSPPRSGSTLLRIMLAGHPKLFAPPELRLLGYNTLQDRKKSLRGRHKFLLDGTIRAIMETKGCDGDDATKIMERYEARDFTAKQFYRELQSWLGDRMLVDKTPNYALDLEVLRRAEAYFDSPRYIHLVRHPHGMIRSYEETKLRLLFRYEHAFSERQLAELIWLINHQNIVQFLAEIPEERKYRLKFEDLVSDPDRVLRGICNFLGLEYVPSMADPYNHPANRMTDGVHSESVMVGDRKFRDHQRVDPSVAERWKENVGRDFLGNITWQLAEQLGYKGLDQEHPNSLAKDRALPLHSDASGRD